LADLSAWFVGSFVLVWLPFNFARMPSILVVVFILQLAIHLVNTVGAQAINDLVIPPPEAAFPLCFVQIH